MTINRRQFLASMGGAAVGTTVVGTLSCGKPSTSAARPNIVLIMADDMGFSDIGCYGGEIKTPNLDRLAGNGLRFTQFYNTARCCPTRASLLTGLYPHQTGVGHMVDSSKPFPGYTGKMSTNCVTIAEALRPAGYRTWMSGKWHVTPVTDSKDNWPLQRGFEQFYGTIHGAGSFFDPVTLTRGNEPEKPEPGHYYTHAIAREAGRMIESHDGRDPFFLYVSFTAPHWPLHALEDDIAKYRGRYQAGWDALRNERHKRLIDMGLVDANWPITARDEEAPAWDDAPDKEWQQRRMEVYAAQVDSMDQAIGRIVDSLSAKGFLDNTLILFLADNGGCAEELRPMENPQRSLHVPHTAPDGSPLQFGNEPTTMPGPANTYQSYGIPWANASNTPFRLYKHWVHEGGIATPLIAHWPRGIKAQNGIRKEPGHLIDIMSTCVDLAGAQYPEQHAGSQIIPMEGTSLAQLFAGGSITRSQPLYWEHEGNRAIRDGKWKLVSRFNNDNRWELYDMENDRTETRDLAETQPEQAATLRASYEAYAGRTMVTDWEAVRTAPRLPIPGSQYPVDRQ